MKTTIKKFQFFDILNEIKDRDSGENNLDNVSPLQMYSIDQNIFLSAKVKVIVNNALKNENYILKIINNKIVDQYSVHTNLSFFLVKNFNNKYYFVTLGNDIKDFSTTKDKKNLKMLTVIKIIEANRLLDPNYVCTDKKIDNEYIKKEISLLRNYKENTFYIGKDYPENVEPVLNVLSFSISNDFQYCAVGLDKGQIILIQVLIF
jgi:hypothetical protein